jgi:protein O-GlcNAc transferase
MSKKPKKKKKRKRHIKRKSPVPFPPSNMDAELQKAIRYHRSGQLPKAESIYKKILHADPNHSDALHLLGFMAHQVGNNGVAVDLLKSAVGNNPKSPVFICHLGDALKDLGRHSEAVSWYQKALELEPHYAEAYNNMGSAFHDTGQVGEAGLCYRKALELNPNYDHALNNMGNVSQDLGKTKKAITYYRKALEQTPDYVEALNNLGTVLKDLGHIDQALSCYRKALQCDPDFVGALVNLGTALGEKGRSDQAVSYYQKALEVHPECDDAMSRLFHQFQQTCEWYELNDWADKIHALTQEALAAGKKPAESPFASLVRYTEPSRNFAVAKSWSLDIARRMSNLEVSFSFDERKTLKEKIVVGYQSNDFRDHPVAHLLGSLFELHDRGAFKVVCYSCGIDDRSNYRKRICKDADKFVDLHSYNHADAAKCIWDDQVDILVELNGYTEGSRLDICALRPAPIQVSYLGFPGTTGANFMDYIIVDKIVAPAEHAPYYGERFVYLPHCYMVTDNGQPISHMFQKREDVGLPQEGFVFCSFNQGFKIDKTTFDTWMTILKEVPRSVLWLQRLDQAAQKNLKNAAEDRKISADRIVFAEKRPLKAEHLGRLSFADLALDTLAFNGHTTTSDVLWAGVPVVAFRGAHFASRVSSSILTAIGLPELVTHSTKDYQTLAVALAKNPEALEKVRKKLLNNLRAAPLFDTPRFVHNLEKAYKEMWEIFLSRKKPEQIQIVDPYVARVDDEPEGPRNPLWKNNSSG